MKILGLLVLAMTLQLSSARADMPSTHGMLLVGNGPFYFSHLPMFHPPHDYQAIFAVELSPEAKAIYLQDKASHPEQKVYTVVPERFSLPEMAAHPRPFQVQVFRGHFERGGVAIAQVAQARIIKVLVFQKLDAQAPRPQKAQYYLFGRPGDAYLAHAITARPNFDEIAAVTQVDQTTQAWLNQQGLVHLTSPSGKDAQPLPASQEQSWVLQEAPRVLSKTGGVEPLYVEFDDLGM